MTVAIYTRYILDTSVLIEAAKRYYAFDIAPTFWAQLVQYALQGAIVSIERVKDEIDKGKDDLRDWCNNHFHNAFDRTEDEAVLDAYAKIIQWAHAATQYTDAAKKELAEVENADAWVVAYAKAQGCVVVTHERYDSKIGRRIPIPNICQALGVPYMDTFAMMRQLGMKL